MSMTREQLEADQMAHVPGKPRPEAGRALLRAWSSDGRHVLRAHWRYWHGEVCSGWSFNFAGLPFCDHSAWWLKGGKVVAFTSHPYPVGAMGEFLASSHLDPWRAFAAKHGLRFTASAESWYAPGQTAFLSLEEPSAPTP